MTDQTYDLDASPAGAAVPTIAPAATAATASAGAKASGLDDALEMLAEQAYEDVAVSEVIRPAAVLPETAARAVLAELSYNSVYATGLWWSSPTLWQRYDRPWNGRQDTQGDAVLLGALQVAYGTPRKYDITIYRATVSMLGSLNGWSVESLCDEALGYGGYTLADCPRADLKPPPKPFRMR